MAVKVFLTGVTGYVGGTVHEHLRKAHPDWDFTLFVRNEKRAEPIKARYPESKFVYGNLDDAAVIEKEAAKADIVIGMADSADHVNAAKAISKGIAEGHSVSKPGYWIHLSGTGILIWYDMQHGRHGEPPLPDQKYNDDDDVDRLISLPDAAVHRNVDKIVQAASSESVRTVIVSPPTIYDQGSGAVNTGSVQAPQLVEATLKCGYAPIIGAGKTEWDNVNVHDLADLYLKLVDATQDPSKNSNPEIFGPRSYFLAENGTHLWADLAEWIADEVCRQGLLSECPTKSVSMEEIGKLGLYAAFSWGLNSKGVALRAKKLLGWAPVGRALKETIPELVAHQAKAMGWKSVQS